MERAAGLEDGDAAGVLGKEPVLGADEVHLWLWRFGRPLPGGSEPEQILSPDELARAGRFKVAGARQQFVEGRTVLRFLIARYLKTAPAALGFEYGRAGKPRLVGQTGEAPLEFNVSHSGEYALYAFSRLAPVGVDIERINPELKVDELAPAILSPGELSAFRGMTPARRLACFFRAWTIKEAALKAEESGFSVEPNSLEPQWQAGEEDFCSIALPGNATADRIWCRAVDLLPNYAAAVALPVPFARTSLVLFNPALPE